MRERRRYILFEVISDSPQDFYMVSREITESCISLIGELGTAKANLKVMKSLFTGRFGVARCSHRYVEEVKLAIGLVMMLGDSRASFNVLGASGTIKALKRRIPNK